MAIRLNTAAVKHANELIDAGKFHADDGHWTITPEEENAMLGDPANYEEYAKFFLGIDEEANPQTKGAYKYPIGKHGMVFRQALIGDRTRSAQNNVQAVYTAAGKLIQRIDNQGKGKPDSKGEFWEIKPKAQGPGNVLLIYGDIGDDPWDEESWGAVRLVHALDAMDGSPLMVRLNSWGGSVADGLAMYNALQRYPGKVTISVDAQAVSIASLIAMAGDEVEMAANALMMIHAPWSMTAGNAVEHREMADTLDTYAAAMLTCYAARVDKATAEAWLADGKDHWFTAEQALDQGLVDSITEARKEAASFARHSRFNPPRRASAMTIEQRKARAKKLDAIFAAHRHITEAAALEREALADTDISVETAQERLDAIVQAHKTPDNSNVVSIADARKGFNVEAKQRAERLDKVFALHRDVEGVAALERKALADPAMTVEAAQTELLALLGASAAPLGGNARVSVTEDERDKFRAGITNSVLARAGYKLDKPDTGNEFRGFTLLEIARASLERKGISTRGMNKLEVVAEAFTTTGSDLGYLTENIAHKFLLKGWDESPETFQKWTSPGVLPDFKPAKRVGLNLFDSLDEVPDGAEYKYGSLSDRGETIALATYGKLLSITRATIINDDLHALSKTPHKMGRAAKRTIGNLVYAVLTSNPNMADGTPLFDAAHKNLAAAAAALDSNTINDMAVAMALQEDPDAKAEGGLNIQLAHVLVPVALKAKALQVQHSEWMVEAGNVNVRQPNTVRDTFTVIPDARLDKNSATAFYGVADPGVADVLEVAYLDGQQEPYLEMQRGYEIDGISYKARIDCGVSPLDFRSFYKNAGA